MAITLDGDNLTTVGVINSKTAVASTSGTSITFTGIPSGVKRITIIFNGVSLSSTSSLLIQLGTSGGVDTSSYVSTSVIARDGTTSTGLTSTSGCVMTVAAAASLVYGTMQIVNVSGNIWVFSSSYGISGATQTGVSGGNKTLSGTLDRVAITTVSGTDTFDAGSINILYE